MSSGGVGFESEWTGREGGSGRKVEVEVPSGAGTETNVHGSTGLA